MALAMVIDDRIDVWDAQSQQHILQVGRGGDRCVGRAEPAAYPAGRERGDRLIDEECAWLGFARLPEIHLYIHLLVNNVTLSLLSYQLARLNCPLTMQVLPWSYYRDESLREAGLPSSADLSEVELRRVKAAALRIRSEVFQVRSRSGSAAREVFQVRSRYGSAAR